MAPGMFDRAGPLPPPLLPPVRDAGLSRPLPDWRILAAFACSVSRTACAVCFTFCPLFSAAVAARSAPSRAVFSASSALTIAAWPNTPALSAEAPRLSLALRSRNWLLRSAKRVPTDSTASGSMLEPRPGATPGVPVPPPPCVDGPLLPDEPPCLRAISHWPRRR
nr:hypothetical protein [Kibdelosporangium sp. MJ126-NF4]CTQ90476.1 hypothetical protein [Kibdelosporangium sp. MJ126-NF4]